MGPFANFSLHVSPNMTAGDLLVGIGTLALASFTAWLAWRTSREVKVGEEQLRLTRESIEAVDRPFVMPTPRINRGIVIAQEALTLKLKNYGKGPALVEGLTMTTRKKSDWVVNPLDGNVRAITPTEALSIRARLRGEAPPEGTNVALTITYRSASGARYSTRSSGVVADEGLVKLGDHRVSIED